MADIQKTYRADETVHSSPSSLRTHTTVNPNQGRREGRETLFSNVLLPSYSLGSLPIIAIARLSRPSKRGDLTRPSRHIFEFLPGRQQPTEVLV